MVLSDNVHGVKQFNVFVSRDVMF